MSLAEVRRTWHLDISVEVLTGLLEPGRRHYEVDPGIPPEAKIDDISIDRQRQVITLHFDRAVPEPIFHQIQDRAAMPQPAAGA